MEVDKEQHSPFIQYEHKVSQSFKSYAIKFLIKLIGLKKGKHTKERLETKQPTSRDVPEPPENLRKHFTITSYEVMGRKIWTLSPQEIKIEKKVIYLHGGSYIHNIHQYQWDFVQELIQKLGCVFIVPDYPLAPNTTYRETFEFMDLVYAETLKQEKGSTHNLIFMGDSAGGGLALAFSQKLKLSNTLGPSQIILLSPWLDITLTNPEILEIDKDDPFLSVEALTMAGKAYAGGDDPNQYLLSPVNGNFEGLGRMSLFVGTHDFLAADAYTMKKKCDDAGVRINYFVYPKMVHVWMVLGLPESRAVIDQISDLIRGEKHI